MYIHSSQKTFRFWHPGLWATFTWFFVLLAGDVHVQAQVKELGVFTATHFDLAFTGPPPFSFARNHRILDSALSLAEEQPNFRYAIENLYLLQQYLSTHPEKQAAMTAAIRAGKIELAAQWSDMQQNLVTGEDLARNILAATEFAKTRFDFIPQMQTLSDVPGQTPQAPQILKIAGLKGLIVTRAGPTDAHLFNWKGLDGSSIPVASQSYVSGHFLGLSESLEAMEGTQLAEFELSDISPDILTNRIKQPAGLEDSIKSMFPGTSDRALVEVSWDNAMPPAKVSANIAAWNEKHGNRIRVIPVLPGEFFRNFWPASVPAKTGEIPSVWTFGTGAIFGGYRQHIRTSHLLLRAEKWASLAEVLTGKPYPIEDLRQGWQEHLITLDHEGESLKRQRDLSEWLAQRTLEESCQAIASHVRIPQKMDIALVVFNPLNWKRSETIATDVYLVGDPNSFFTRPYHKLELLGPDGQVVPFEIISTESVIIRTIKIRFRAQDIPPLGWKTYYLRPAQTHQAKSFPEAVKTKGKTAIQGTSFQVEFNAKAATFLISESASAKSLTLSYHHQPAKVTDKPGFFRVKDAGNPISVKWRQISHGENLAGPYLDGEGEVEGAVLKVRIQLDGAGPIAVSESVRWNGSKTVKLIRQIEFHDRGKFVYGVPFGTQEFDNLMENAGPPKDGSADEVTRDYWYKNREFDGWVAWRSPDHQVTMAGESRGGAFEGDKLKVTLLSSGGELVAPDAITQTTPNEFLTRFLLSFSAQPEASPRLGWELYNPLETMVSVGYLSGSLPAEFTGVANVGSSILTTLKKAESGKGWIARAYASQQETAWPQIQLAREGSIQPVSLTEADEPKQIWRDTLHAFEIRTVRLELAK